MLRARASPARRVPVGELASSHLARERNERIAGEPGDRREFNAVAAAPRAVRPAAWRASTRMGEDAAKRAFKANYGKCTKLSKPRRIIGDHPPPIIKKKYIYIAPKKIGALERSSCEKCSYPSHSQPLHFVLTDTRI